MPVPQPKTKWRPLHLFTRNMTCWYYRKLNSEIFDPMFQLWQRYQNKVEKLMILGQLNLK